MNATRTESASRGGTSARSRRGAGSRGLRWLVAVTAMLALGGTARVARADDPTEAEIAEARKSFELGKKLEDEDQWGEALETFRKVAQVKTTPQVLFHIALAEENLGHLAKALRGFRDAQAMAEKDPEGAKHVLENAPEHIEALRARTPLLRVEVDGTDFARVTVDGEALPPEALGTDVPMDPGKHTIVLEPASDGKPTERDVFLTERANEKVRLVAHGKSEVKAPIVPVAPKPTRPEITHGSKVPAIIAGSVGVASLVGAGVFLGLRQSSIAQVEASCRDQVNDRYCDPKLAPVADRGRTYTYASASLAAVGAAALATGAVLWFTVGADKTPRATATRVTVTPGMLSVGGTF